MTIGVFGPAEPERIARNYDVRRDAQGRVSELVEKPVHPTGGVIGLGNCLFRRSVLAHAFTMAPNRERGQKELTGLIQCAIDDGEVVDTFEACGDYVNVNTPEDLHAARSLLAMERARNRPQASSRRHLRRRMRPRSQPDP